MTKLVKTSTEIEGAGSDFAEKLTASLDPCMARFSSTVKCALEAGHAGLHRSDDGAVEWQGLRTVAIDTETFEWDSKKRFDDRTDVEKQMNAVVNRINDTLTPNERRQVKKMFNFGVGAGMGRKELNLTVEEAEKLRKEFDEKFPGAKEALDMLARNGIKLDQAKVDALAQRVSGDFSNMRREISNEWARLFGGETLREVARSVADKAIEQAMEFGVPATAETTISPCGCVWALSLIHI